MYDAPRARAQFNLQFSVVAALQPLLPNPTPEDMGATLADFLDKWLKEELECSVAEAVQGGTTPAELLVIVGRVTTEAVAMFVTALPRLRRKRALVRATGA